jgi:Protein of unknown function (DUF3501)
MRPIQRNEILPIGDYEGIRPRFRARVIEEKRLRRVKLGDHVSAVFENRDSVLLQIQEMLWIERITSEPALLHEIETYNALVPAAGELSLTLFVEIADKETRDRALVELAGLEDHVAIEVDGELHRAKEERPPGWQEGRTTAVHYFKVPLPPAAAASIAARGAKAAVVVDHPRYAARADLGPETLAKVAEDLAEP